MSFSRRDVLKLALLAAGHPLLPVRGIVSQAFAAPGAADARFLLVFLRGGYDAANTIVPIGSDLYYEVRPTIAIARPERGNPNAAIPLARSGDAAAWGLHPALQSSLLPMWQHGQLAFVPFAGTDDLTRSHFETQDSMESGLPVTSGGHGPQPYTSGFLNRLAGALGARATPVSFTSGLPLIMTGNLLVPNVSVESAGEQTVSSRQSEILAGMYAGTRFEPLIREGQALRQETDAELLAPMATPTAGQAGQGRAMAADGRMDAGAKEMAAASRNAESAQGFALEARRMAVLMREKFNIGFIDVGGWDTHIGEGSAQGYLAGLLAELGLGLATFAQQMGPAWNHTIVVVISEFGRTFRENGTRGTDHGHGSVHWVLGGAMQGGRVAGEQVPVTEKTLNENRDFPVLTHYRALIGGLVKRMYQLDAARLDQVFPRSVPLDLGLI